MIESRVFISLFQGALVGAVLQDFPPIITQFFASALGTFLLLFTMLYMFERKASNLKRAFIISLVFTIILRGLIYGTNKWYNARKEDEDIKLYEQDGSILFVDKIKNYVS